MNTQRARDRNAFVSVLVDELNEIYNLIASINGEEN